MKVAIFPYNNEFEPIITYGDLLQNISIQYLLAPHGFGLNESHIRGHKKKYIIKNEIEDECLKEIDGLMLVNSEQEIPFKLFYDQIEKFIKQKKKIIIARNFAKEEIIFISKLCELNGCELINYEYNSVKNNDIPDDLIMEIGDLQVPIIVVAGNGENCNKYEIQLEIRRQFLQSGYKVCSIGSRQFSEISGIHSFPYFMLDTRIGEEEKMIRYNQYIKYLEQSEKPDVFVIGVPGGLLPITKKKTAHFGLSAFEIFNSVSPDFTILALHKDEYQEAYFDEINRLLSYRFNTEADCFVVSNCSYDRFSIGSFMPIKYLKHNDFDVLEQCNKYVHNVFCKSTYTDMGQFLIDTLAGYDELKVL